MSLIARNEVSLQFCPTDLMIPDVTTKPLPNFARLSSIFPTKSSWPASRSVLRKMYDELDVRVSEREPIVKWRWLLAQCWNCVKTFSIGLLRTWGEQHNISVNILRVIKGEIHSSLNNTFHRMDWPEWIQDSYKGELGVTKTSRRHPHLRCWPIDTSGHGNVLLKFSFFRQGAAARKPFRDALQLGCCQADFIYL